MYFLEVSSHGVNIFFSQSLLMQMKITITNCCTTEDKKSYLALQANIWERLENSLFKGKKNNYE